MEEKPDGEQRSYHLLSRIWRDIKEGAAYCTVISAGTYTANAHQQHCRPIASDTQKHRQQTSSQSD